MATSGGIESFFFGVYPTAGTLAASTKVTGDAFNRWELYADGTQKFGPGSGATDVTIGRTATTTFDVTGTLRASLDIRARNGAATTVIVGAQGPASQAGMVFSSAFDTNLYRFGPAVLRTDGQFHVGTKIYAKVGAAAETGIGDMGPASEAGIQFGTAGTEKIYRSGALAIRTTAALTVDLGMTVSGGNFSVNGSNDMIGTGNVFSWSGNTGQIELMRGTGNNPTIAFRSNGDTTLWSPFAQTLQTPSAFRLDNGVLAGAAAAALGLYAGTGAPNNANGTDGDLYFRSDGGALTTVYQRRAGVWTGVV